MFLALSAALFRAQQEREAKLLCAENFSFFFLALCSLKNMLISNRRHAKGGSEGTQQEAGREWFLDDFHIRNLTGLVIAY